MKKRYIVVLVIMIVCILSTIKFTYGRFTYESEVLGTVTTTSRNPFNVGTLAYSIVDNAMNGNSENQQKTIYSETPKTKPAQEINEENERTLSVTEDDLGNSYYYRGNVLDNYIDFNNMCFRIVRIEGDGAIKLILEDKEHVCSEAIGAENSFIGTGQYGYNNTTLNEVENVIVGDYEKCTSNKDNCMKTKFDDWLDKNNFDKRLLKEDTWNLGDLNTFYTSDSYGSIVDYRDTSSSSLLFRSALMIGWNSNTPLSLLKSEKESTVKDYVATLSAEEVAYAGARWSNSNTNYYLYNKTHDWLLLSLYKINVNRIHVFHVAGETGPWWTGYSGKGSLLDIEYYNYNSKYLRPSIVLKSNIKLISGDGTKNNAYKVDENPFDDGTLAYNIVKNAQNVRDKKDTSNTTKLSPVPETTPAKEPSDENERTLSLAEDDNGASYYFRGNIQDNFINFAKKCWRIVRIEGDGSIKLILDYSTKKCEEVKTDNQTGSIGNSNAFIGQGVYGYTKDNDLVRLDYINNEGGKLDNKPGAKQMIDDWLNSTNNISDSDKSKLKTDNWCIGNTTDWFEIPGQSSTNYQNKLYSEAYRRLFGLETQKTTSLRCNGNKDEKVIDYGGLLTVDEIVNAGYLYGNNEVDNYCYLNIPINNNNNNYWWLLTPAVRDANYDYVFDAFGGDGINYVNGYGNMYGIRPSIVLKSDIEYVSGDGTQENPYQI